MAKRRNSMKPQSRRPSDTSALKTQPDSKDTLTTLPKKENNDETCKVTEETFKVVDISVNDEKQETIIVREGGLFPDFRVIKKSFPGTP